MADGYLQFTPGSQCERVDTTTLQRNGLELHRQRIETYPGVAVNSDASARTRVSQLTTLFDGKTLRAEDPLLWDTQGTGTRTFEDGSINDLAVTAGQYLVRQSKQYLPYFSGKSQFVEITFDTFGTQEGVTKRVGYFSSSATAPFDDNFDGWYLESSDTIYLVVVNDGTEVLRKPINEWLGYSQLSTYDWDNFTVVLVDFLWLGGATLRLFVKNPAGGFTLAHQFDYAGTQPGVFMRSPNLPVRYEIRSTTGAGSFRAICSQVATEGALSTQSKSLALWHDTLLSANSVGTIYAVKGVKKRAAFRDIPVEINQFGGSMTATTDAGIWMLLLNPTLSAPLTYAPNDPVDEATATNQTVTATGRTLGTIHVNQAGVSIPFEDNALSWMGSTITDVMDEYVLAYLPLTQNQTVNGAISLQVY
jgi:hypothetical protein